MDAEQARQEDPFRKPIIKFEHKPVGSISYGPSHKLVCSLTRYRTSDHKLRYFCDLRMTSYNAKQNRYNNSRKGITIPPRCLLEVINTINALPLDPPTDLPDNGNRVIHEIRKNKVVTISISLTGIERTPKLDIREKVEDLIHGFSGLTYRGVRMPYDLIGGISNMLQTCYNMILDTGWKPEPLTSQSK